jgi:hypothetical protein
MKGCRNHQNDCDQQSHIGPLDAIFGGVPREISGTVPNLFKLGEHEILKKTSWK